MNCIKDEESWVKWAAGPVVLILNGREPETADVSGFMKTNLASISQRIGELIIEIL